MNVCLLITMRVTFSNEHLSPSTSFPNNKISYVPLDRENSMHRKKRNFSVHGSLSNF